MATNDDLFYSFILTLTQIQRVLCTSNIQETITQAKLSCRGYLFYSNRKISRENLAILNLIETVY